MRNILDYNEAKHDVVIIYTVHFTNDHPKYSLSFRNAVARLIYIIYIYIYIFDTHHKSMNNKKIRMTMITESYKAEII